MRISYALIRGSLWQLVVCMLFLTNASYGQGQRNVSGTIKDQTGETLPGVAVNIENTTTGTITDVDGNFSIQAEDGEVLIFTMVGMEPTQRVVSATQNWNIVLQESTAILDEIVVTGFQEVDRKLFTGSSENVKMADIRIDGVADASRSLEGRVAGVSVENVSGTFGTAPRIRIRGNTSINGNNQPLFVVDGVILEDLANVNTEDLLSGNANTLISSSVANINPDDIESFQVLKDASATAIYGARAANGVIVITTKRGKKRGFTGELLRKFLCQAKAYLQRFFSAQFC